MLELGHADGMNPDETFACGQCFRWERTEEGWRGIVGHRAVLVRAAGESLYLDGLTGYRPECEENFWRGYFALDLDYSALQDVFCQAHPRLGGCVSAAPGIRVLRQPYFETLLTFLISQNNNIPRIHAIIARLCEGLGEPIGEGLYTFPAPEVLARREEADLTFLRAGWRSAYLIDAARKTAEGVLTETMLRAMPTAAARQALQSIRGVGPKVADCTLLYGLGRWDAYPIDVWMKRADRLLFTARVKDAGAYLNRRTGGFAGIAQQYIFAWMRANGSERA